MKTAGIFARFCGKKIKPRLISKYLQRSLYRLIGDSKCWKIPLNKPLYSPNDVMDEKLIESNYFQVDQTRAQPPYYYMCVQGFVSPVLRYYIFLSTTRDLDTRQLLGRICEAKIDSSHEK